MFVHTFQKAVTCVALIIIINTIVAVIIILLYIIITDCFDVNDIDMASSAVLNIMNRAVEKTLGRQRHLTIV